MTINKLASEIAKREGKKSQARIGDVREILGILSDILFEISPAQFFVLRDNLLSNGVKRAAIKVRALKKGKKNATTK